MTIAEMAGLVGTCSFPDYVFTVWEDKRGAICLQARYPEPCVETGKPEWQYTRRWFLSPAMTKSEVVQTAFKCIVTSMEHRAREHFHYRGRAVFGPHGDVDLLWEMAGPATQDRREEATE